MRAEVSASDAPVWLSADAAYGWACGYNAAVKKLRHVCMADDVCPFEEDDETVPVSEIPRAEPPITDEEWKPMAEFLGIEDA